jgi:hypothetical protein
MFDNREDIENRFDVNHLGVITTPGKFEGQPVWVPYLWAEAGFNPAFQRSDEHGGEYVALTIIRPADAAKFEGVPEYGILVLQSTTRGDVFSYEYSETEVHEIEQRWGFDASRVLEEWTRVRAITQGAVQWAA